MNSVSGKELQDAYLSFVTNALQLNLSFVNKGNILREQDAFNVKIVKTGKNDFGKAVSILDESLWNEKRGDIKALVKEYGADKKEIFKILFSYEMAYASILSQYNKWSRENCCIHFLESPISQYFRRVLALKMKIDHGYDYKTYPCVMLSEKTALELKGVGYENR